MNIAKLNPEQRAAVLLTEGPLLLLAGAGSGKTRVITMRIAYLLREKRIAPENILAVTFTNKASREMLQRVIGLVGRERCSGIAISTFHALGMRILRSGIERLGYKKNFSIYIGGDQERLIRDLVRATDAGGTSLVSQVLWCISSAKNRLITPRNFKPRHNDPVSALAARIYPLYQRALRACNAVDFDDILMLSAQLLVEHADLLTLWRRQFRYVMVDEYQDTNFAQYQLLRLLCDEHRNLCVVGDDDQSIYGWRGAAPENILDFERDYKGARVIKLEQNYRSTCNILAAANAVIGNNPRPHPKKLWSAAGAGAGIELLSCHDDEEEARFVVQRIQTQRADSSDPFSAFAILYRTNAQSRAFEEQLRYENIPYVLIGGQQFFDRKEVKDALAYLRVIANPQDDVNLLRILNYPKRGIGEQSAHTLIETSARLHKSIWEILRHPQAMSHLGEKSLTAMYNFTALIVKFRQRFRSSGPAAKIFRELIEEIGMEDDIWRAAENIEQGKRRLENLVEAVNALAAYEEREAQPTLAGFLEKVSLLDADEPNREEKENKLRREAVVLMSLHASKGLEFPHVFLAGIEEETLPHCTADGEAADLAEERRLLYVGITRAQKTLTLLHARHRKKYGKLRPRQPSRFLSEIPVELLRDSSLPSPVLTEEEKDQAANAFFANLKARLEE
ncbi:MAG: UvrD-helicase domain-containing protein [Desulfuromonadales bacterium]|nr:UvrD-helicase domain-containing protein [Desulfuromonadales bacterium]